MVSILSSSIQYVNKFLQQNVFAYINNIKFYFLCRYSQYGTIEIQIFNKDLVVIGNLYYNKQGFYFYHIQIVNHMLKAANMSNCHVEYRQAPRLRTCLLRQVT